MGNGKKAGDQLQPQLLTLQGITMTGKVRQFSLKPASRLNKSSFPEGPSSKYERRAPFQRITKAQLTLKLIVKNKSDWSKKLGLTG